MAINFKQAESLLQQYSDIPLFTNDTQLNSATILIQKLEKSSRHIQTHQNIQEKIYKNTAKIFNEITKNDSEIDLHKYTVEILSKYETKISGLDASIKSSTKAFKEVSKNSLEKRKLAEEVKCEIERISSEANLIDCDISKNKNRIRDIDEEMKKNTILHKEIEDETKKTRKTLIEEEKKKEETDAKNGPKIEQFSKSNTELNEKIKEIRLSLKSILTSNDDLRKQNTELSEQTQQAAQQITQISFNKSRLEAKNQKLKEEITRLEKNRHEEDKSLLCAKTQVAENSSKLNKRKLIANSQRMVSRDLKERLADAKGQLKEEEKTISQMVSKLSELDELIEVSRTEIESVKKRFKQKVGAKKTEEDNIDKRETVPLPLPSPSPSHKKNPSRRCKDKAKDKISKIYNWLRDPVEEEVFTERLPKQKRASKLVVQKRRVKSSVRKKKQRVDCVNKDINNLTKKKRKIGLSGRKTAAKEILLNKSLNEKLDIGKFETVSETRKSIFDF